VGLLSKEVFVCLDCETTGLEPKLDRVIEVAAVRFTFDEILEEFDTLIDPGCPIPEESTKIHHITNEMVAGKPSFNEVLPEVLRFVGNHYIVGHGILFDLEVLFEESKRCGIDTPFMRQKYFDTLRLARLYGGSDVNSLKMLGEHFNVGREGAHRAMNDVRMNVDVFKHLTKRFKTTVQIDEALSRPIELKKMPLGKHKGRLFKELPTNYLRWAAAQSFDQDLLYSLRLELKKRKKGDRFADSTSPFKDLEF
jgi:DNA polymerase-3 subunit epsilon